jgi:hypothetical protein
MNLGSAIFQKARQMHQCFKGDAQSAVVQVEAGVFIEMGSASSRC